MMKKIATLFIVLVFFWLPTKAQTSLTVPYGSFEQWTSHSGYGISFFGSSIPVYGTYYTPTGWYHLSYPVNENLSFLGLTITINTNLPLIMASEDTAAVPAGNKAAKLESFMLEDIIEPTVYALAESNLDSMLTETVFPSILCNGAINLNNFMPYISAFSSGMDSLASLLTALDTVDVNHLITGGMALGTFEPTRLTGSYKYSAAGTGDNGGVVILGTHYNTTTHKRDIVGGGANVALTNAANYTPFTLFYQSLHELLPSEPEQAPDSLIVLILSSASATMQQGSTLYIDNLVLWHDTVADPDTCAAIVGLTAAPAIHNAVLNWTTADVVNGYELEYGIAGFTQGNGTLVTLTNNTYTLTSLAANTTYDVYLRTHCDDSVYGDWSTLQFTTLSDTCASIVGLTATPDIHEAVLNWSAAAVVSGYELEYGAAGFTQGNGTLVTLTNNTYTLTSLAASTTYDVYLRTVCTDSLYGDWSTIQFTTLPDTCASIVGLTATPDIHEALLNWNTTGTVNGYELEYGTAGFAQGNGTQVTLTANTYTFTGLDANTTYDVYLRTLCADSVYGDWSTLQFTTLPDTCASIREIYVTNQVVDAFPMMVIEWYGSSQPDHWEVEYGPQGFALGQGTLVTTHENYFEIYPLERDGSLQPNTWYDFYVRSVCEDSVYGEWDSVQYRTFCASVDGLTVHSDSISVNSSNLIEGYKVTWVDTTDTQEWSVGYGETSNPIPDMSGNATTVHEPVYYLPALRPNKQYYVEVIAYCGDGNYGEARWVYINTPAVGIEETDALSLSVYPNPASGSCEVSLSSGEPAELKLFSLDGRLLQTLHTTGAPVQLQLPAAGLYLLQATTPSGTTTRKIINK